ncbi:lipopolysaccharide biosynthesis protein [Terrimonas pollutisoli]|uniref:lipopolysaccharide biosynthesis protein n=1 Tax=Terrimonas pollutisoli TaxID=3034147 RepID=UPI0023ED7B2F|nr:lipopolysaccharide biosynthesis protein [Terrimonas sp. H1YJ31]
MEKGSRNIIFKDTFFYLVGAMVPILIGAVRSPIYTRHFSTEDFGIYSLVFLFFSYVSIICYSWIVTCGWRYYYQYKQNGRTGVLFSNLVFLFLLFSILILIFSAVWHMLADHPLLKRLIFLCFLQFFTSEIVNLFLIPLRLEGGAFRYNVIQIIRSVASFVLLLLLTFVFDYGIESFLTSIIFLNIVLILVIVIPYILKMKISFNRVNKEDLTILYKYGQIGLVANLCMTLLVSSDRFVIEHFDGLSKVGIYNQNYNIAQISIAALVYVYWAALDATLLKSLEFQMDSEVTKKRLSQTFNTWALLFLPLTVYFILYAREIGVIMLGEEFRIGYPIIFMAAIVEFVKGFGRLPEWKLKFRNKVRLISITYISAVLCSIGLNMFFVPLFGYQSAGVTAIIISFSASIIFGYAEDRNYNIRTMLKDGLFRISIIILATQVMIHCITSTLKMPLYFYILEGGAFALSYFGLIIKNKRFSLKFAEVKE